MPSGSISISGSAHDSGESAAQLQAEIEAATRAALDQAGREMVMVAVAAAPRKTGFMASRIQAEVEGASAVTLSLPGVKYAEPQEDGAGAHEIGAPGQNLYNAEDAFEATGPVMHPGNVGRHFLRNAWQAVGSRFTSIWDRYLP